MYSSGFIVAVFFLWTPKSTNTFSVVTVLMTATPTNRGYPVLTNLVISNRWNIFNSATVKLTTTKSKKVKSENLTQNDKFIQLLPNRDIVQVVLCYLYYIQ